MNMFLIYFTLISTPYCNQHFAVHDIPGQYDTEALDMPDSTGTWTMQFPKEHWPEDAQFDIVNSSTPAGCVYRTDNFYDPDDIEQNVLMQDDKIKVQDRVMTMFCKKNPRITIDGPDKRCFKVHTVKFKGMVIK